MIKMYRYFIGSGSECGSLHSRVKRSLMLVFVVNSLCQSVLAGADDTEPVITNTWTLTETLLALDAIPQAIADSVGYKNWTGGDLPDDIEDIGVVSQPNLELISQLSPRLFLTEEYLKLDDRLPQFYAIPSLPQPYQESNVWEGVKSLTREVSVVVNTRLSYDELMVRYEKDIDKLKARVEGFNSPLLIIHALDDRHARVFGEGSLVHVMLEKLGINNAWDRQTTGWGYSVVSIEELISVNARLVIIEQPGAYNNSNPQSYNSGLWSHIPSIQNGTAVFIPSFWMFGALPSALRFAESLVEALEASSGSEEASAWRRER